MKKTLALLTAVAFCAAPAFSAVTMTELADMDALVAAAGTVSDTVTKNTAYTNDTVYNFSDKGYTTDQNNYQKGAGAIYNIANLGIISKVVGGTGYLTVAAWINPSVTGENSIFSFGAKEDGIKFGVKEGGLQVTTKNVADNNMGDAVPVKANEWTMVAVSINLANRSARFYVGSTMTADDDDVGQWKTPGTNDLLFAIGSGNGNGVRDGYIGDIANLSVAFSDALPEYADIAALVGANAPTLNVPEPATASLSLLGLAALMMRRRRA